MYKTAEYVTMSHPDKVCDQIADALLDACLSQDPETRSAIEVMGGHGQITVSGELTTNAIIDIEKITRETCHDCGYHDEIAIAIFIAQQSHEIGSGVDNDGAGDQGIMVGYATNETPELMPKEFVIARELTLLMGKRDGKAQVTLNEKGELIQVITSVAESTTAIQTTLSEYLQSTFQNLSWEQIHKKWRHNPNGTWTISGFHADTGLTGRKIVVDSYGPRVPVGGGAFSGKDATKVDRSGAYMARYIAVDLLKKHHAKEVLVELAYAIGVAEPISAHAIIDGVAHEIEGYDLRPKAIIEFLGLKKPGFLERVRRGLSEVL